MSATTQCAWCHAQFPVSELSCPRCGASVDVSVVTDATGWVESPPIRDMAKLQIGRSSAQIEGTQVPVVDLKLADGDGVYCTHDKLLWHDGKVTLGNWQGASMFKRMRAGMPLVMLQIDGPGRVAFSDNMPGELVAVPLDPGTTLSSREHHMLVATRNVTFNAQQAHVWYQTGSGNDSERHYPMGAYFDAFHTADQQPGLVMLHASGNVFVRDLAARQSVDVAPHALLGWMGYTQPHMLVDRTRSAGITHRLRNVIHYLGVRVIGPGRLWIQSGARGETEEWEPITADSGAGFGYGLNLGADVLQAAVQVAGSIRRAAPTGPDLAGRLSKLAALHDLGVLTDEEFETQKKKLLDK